MLDEDNKFSEQVFVQPQAYINHLPVLNKNIYLHVSVFKIIHMS